MPHRMPDITGNATIRKHVQLSLTQPSEDILKRAVRMERHFTTIKDPIDYCEFAFFDEDDNEIARYRTYGY